jgi:hypothetical protein
MSEPMRGNETERRHAHRVQTLKDAIESGNEVTVRRLLKVIAAELPAPALYKVGDYMLRKYR